jgi:hypothetical protein
VLNLSDSIASLAVAIASVFALHWPTLRYGLNLCDEGYLWYGSVQTLKGKVPIRDFRGYDLGRYYWCALWMRLLGARNGSVRIAMMAVEVGGVWLATVLVYAATHAWPAAILWCLVITSCGHPWYRSVESTFSFAGVAMAAVLVNSPTPAHAMAVGFLGALMTLAGLNVAIYNCGGVLLAIFFASGSTSFAHTLVSYLAGVALGLGVLMILFALIPGFLRAYWQRKLLPILKRGTTNLPVPIPWLWRKTPGGRFIKTCFTVLPLFYAISLVWLLIHKHPLSDGNTAFTAAVCVGVFYLHYALSRADAEHLLVAIQPWFIAIAPLLFGTWLGGVASAAIAGAVITRVHLSNNLFLAHRRDPAAFRKYSLDGDLIWVPKPMAADLDAIGEAVNAHTLPGEPAFFAPVLVTFYPLFARRPAAYDIFCVYPAKPKAQEQMIASMTRERLRLALVFNMEVDGRPERRFSNTHPLVWNHLRARYQCVPLPTSWGDDLHCFIEKHD